MKALKAVGIKVEAEGYNHTTKTHWKIVPDGSVTHGFEVVSPVLKGEKGLEEAIIAATALSDAGAYANRSCGFHVHFDASDLKAKHVKCILRRYAEFESQIDSFMPPSRRGNENQYCQSLNSIITPEFENASTMDELIHLQHSRYFKVNLHSFHRHGTIEFRQHSGTVNASKIENWVRFVADFIDQCKKIANSEGEAQTQAMPTVSGILGKLANVLTTRGTMELSEICNEFSWLEHTARSAVARLRKQGIEIKAIKVAGKLAYRIGGAMQEEGLWTGISRRVAIFYQRRAAAMAA